MSINIQDFEPIVTKKDKELLMNMARTIVTTLGKYPVYNSIEGVQCNYVTAMSRAKTAAYELFDWIDVLREN